VLVVSEQWLQAEAARDEGAIAALFTEKRDPLSRGSGAGERKGGHRGLQTQDFADDPQEAASWTTDRVDVAASG
jgi:hypothetical protein